MVTMSCSLKELRRRKKNNISITIIFLFSEVGGGMEWEIGTPSSGGELLYCIVLYYLILGMLK